MSNRVTSLTNLTQYKRISRFNLKFDKSGKENMCNYLLGEYGTNKESVNKIVNALVKFKYERSNNSLFSVTNHEAQESALSELREGVAQIASGMDEITKHTNINDTTYELMSLVKNDGLLYREELPGHFKGLLEDLQKTDKDFFASLDEKHKDFLEKNGVNINDLAQQNDINYQPIYVNKIPSGMNNRRNDCFAISALQLILANPPMINALLDLTLKSSSYNNDNEFKVKCGQLIRLKCLLIAYIAKDDKAPEDSDKLIIQLRLFTDFATGQDTASGLLSRLYGNSDKVEPITPHKKVNLDLLKKPLDGNLSFAKIGLQLITETVITYPNHDKLVNFLNNTKNNKIISSGLKERCTQLLDSFKEKEGAYSRINDEIITKEINNKGSVDDLLNNEELSKLADHAGVGKELIHETTKVYESDYLGKIKMFMQQNNLQAYYPDLNVASMDNLIHANTVLQEINHADEIQEIYSDEEKESAPTRARNQKLNQADINLINETASQKIDSDEEKESTPTRARTQKLDQADIDHIIQIENASQLINQFNTLVNSDKFQNYINGIFTFHDKSTSSRGNQLNELINSPDFDNINAIILYRGRVRSGHYISYIRGENGNGYIYDDANVQKITTDELKTNYGKWSAVTYTIVPRAVVARNNDNECK